RRCRNRGPPRTRRRRGPRPPAADRRQPPGGGSGCASRRHARTGGGHPLLNRPVGRDVPRRVLRHLKLTLCRRTRGKFLSPEKSVAEIEVAREQAYVSMLYERLDEVRAEAAQRRRGVARKAGNTPQAGVEWEAFNTLHAQRLAALDAGARGLCFGRLDL